MTEPQRSVTNRIMPTMSQVSNPVIDPIHCPVKGCSFTFRHTRNPRKSLASHLRYMIKNKNDAAHISAPKAPSNRRQYTDEQALAARKASTKKYQNKPETKSKRKHQRWVRQGKKAATAEFALYRLQPSEVEMTQYVENYIARHEEAECLYPQAPRQAPTSPNT
ncbi:hypothetical protein L873DRAFT_1818359, partial [Choiromyces venosus 120613-1]